MTKLAIRDFEAYRSAARRPTDYGLRPANDNRRRWQNGAGRLNALSQCLPSSPQPCAAQAGGNFQNDVITSYNPANQQNGISGFTLNTGGGEWVICDKVGGTWNMALTSVKGAVGVSGWAPSGYALYSTKDIYSLQETNLIPILVEAIKEQQAEIVQLRADLAARNKP